MTANAHQLQNVASQETHPSAAERVAEWIRAGTARAAKGAEGVALAFTQEPCRGKLILAASSGLASGAAEGLVPTLSKPMAECLDSVSPKSCPPLAGPGTTAGIILPFDCEGRVHGVLIVASRVPLSDRAGAFARSIAETLAVRLDHAYLANHLASLHSLADEKERDAEEKGDEILKLSEALFAQDIELLENHEKLDEIEKLKNDFIEKMSRELRTPLNSIVESIITVLAGEHEALSKDARASLRGALDESTAFLRTLQNILDLWRIKQGEMSLEIHEVNFREVVEEAIFSVQDTLGGKPVVIGREIAEPFPRIRTDLAKLNQILFLLLDNSAKFTATGRIDIHGELRDGELCCTVKDTGIGIAPDDRQFLFDEFFQVDDLASTRYRGAGLGLALARDLVNLLGGELSLESEVGQGTAVRLSLPVQTNG